MVIGYAIDPWYLLKLGEQCEDWLGADKPGNR